jgi:hypothetical protein
MYMPFTREHKTNVLRIDALHMFSSKYVDGFVQYNSHKTQMGLKIFQKTA